MSFRGFMSFSVICILAVVASGAARAQTVRINGPAPASPYFGLPVAPSGAVCDPNTATHGISDLTPAEQTQLQRQGYAYRGELVRGDSASPASALSFERGYAFGHMSGVDPRLIMWIYTNYDQHAGASHLGNFIVRSQIVPRGAATASRNNVLYEQNSPVGANGIYTVDDHIRRWAGGDGYELVATLATGAGVQTSSDSPFAPRWLSGYFRVQSDGANGSFVVACNYMVPRLGTWVGYNNGILPYMPGLGNTPDYVQYELLAPVSPVNLLRPIVSQYNEASRSRLKSSAQNLLRWVQRSASVGTATFVSELEARLNR